MYHGRDHWYLRKEHFQWKGMTGQNEWVVESKILKGWGANSTRQCDWSVSYVGKWNGGNRGQTARAEE